MVHISGQVFCSWKSCRLRDSYNKYGRSREAVKDSNKTRHKKM